MPFTNPLRSFRVPIPEPQFDDLFREIILDHYRKPRNRGELPGATYRLEGVNPVCGDEIHLDLEIGDDVLRDVKFDGQGCSISQSSASMMTDRIRGRSLDEAEDVLQKFKAMMVDGAVPDRDLGDLEALEGVAKFPVRVKCALLAWNVLQQGLEKASSPA